MNDEYFIHDRADDDRHPLLGGAKGEDRMRLFRGREVDLELFADDPLRLRLGAPVPRKPVMVDYHSLPDPVVSTKLHDVLAPLRLHQVQFVPAVVDIKGSSMPYWYVNNYNRISCINEKRSKLEFDDAHEHVSEIEKLVLDEKVLAETPLERRLYFTLKEDISIYVMHRSIMDVVLSANPVGIRFWPVEEWNDSIEFS